MLKVKNLSVTLDDVPIIERLDFELKRGENLAVIGPNGSGKTVLLKTFLGLIPHDGTIEWSEGVRLGYVPQKIDADRHLPMTIQNLLSAKARTLRLPSSEIAWAVKASELSEKIQKTPVGHLSGGQFQRALIAFSLLGRPSVLLLDEPTASIDERGEAQIYELIHELQDTTGMTVILVSHDLSFVYRYAKKVLCLNKTGICFGVPQEVLTPQVLEKLYGGPQKYYQHEHR